MKTALLSILALLLSACVIQQAPHPSTVAGPDSAPYSLFAKAPVWKIRRNHDDGSLVIVAWDTPQRAEMLIACISAEYRPYLLDPRAEHIVVFGPLSKRPAESKVDRVRGNYRVDQNAISEALLEIDQIEPVAGGGFVVGFTESAASKFLSQLRASMIGVSMTLADGQTFSYRVSPEGRSLMDSYLTRPCPWR